MASAIPGNPISVGDESESGFQCCGESEIGWVGRHPGKESGEAGSFVEGFSERKSWDPRMEQFRRFRELKLF